MRRRFYTRPPLEYLVYTAIGLAAAWASYEIRLQYLDKQMERVSSHTAQLFAAPPSRPLRITPGQSEAETQRQREMAEAMAAQRAAEQRKQEAWERFYQPPRACTYPESSRRVAVCQANEQKQREAFELTWAPQVQQ